MILSIVSHGRLFRQAVDPGDVVQPAVDTAKLVRMNEALQDLVHGVAIAEIKEVERCPYVRRVSSGDPVGDELSEVSHVRYLYTFFGRPELAQVGGIRSLPIAGTPSITEPGCSPARTTGWPSRRPQSGIGPRNNSVICRADRVEPINHGRHTRPATSPIVIATIALADAAAEPVAT